MFFIGHFFGDCLLFIIIAHTFEAGCIRSWAINALKTNSSDTIFAHKLDLFLSLRLGPSTALAMLSLFVFFQVKEERNQVILDNEELQEQLDIKPHPEVYEKRQEVLQEMAAQKQNIKEAKGRLWQEI